jgi:acyl-CoA reductase-like NAD-dependent aldehyde dehydrogenase
MSHAYTVVMTPRSHTALRIAALAWIMAMALIPRGVWGGIWGTSPSVTASAGHPVGASALDE